MAVVVVVVVAEGEEEERERMDLDLENWMIKNLEIINTVHQHISAETRKRRPARFGM